MEGGDTTGIGLRKVQNVVSKEREVSLADIGIRNQLVLAIDAFRLVLLNHCWCGPVSRRNGINQIAIAIDGRRIDVLAQELMHAASIQIIYG